MKRAEGAVPAGTPLVSVIVPVYNAEKSLECCIESALAQTYNNLELILIDDGSTDISGKICDAWAGRDARIKVFHRANGGPSAARNCGIKEAKGELFFFLDADDRLPCGAVSCLVENYSANGADMVAGDFSRVSDSGRPVAGAAAFPDSRLLQKPDIAAYAFAYLRSPNRTPLFAYAWGRLFKAAIIRKKGILFNTALSTFEDVAFNFDYLKYADTVSFVKNTVYEHRIYENYSSATMAVRGDTERMFGYRQALESISRFLSASGIGSGIREAVAHANVSLTIIQLVRICGQIVPSNKATLHKLVKEVLMDPVLRGNLRFYRPSGRDSRLLPLLMKLNLPSLVVMVCRYKAAKRYGKGVPPCLARKK